MSFIDPNLINSIILKWIENIGIGGLAMSPVFIFFVSLRWIAKLINSMSS